MPSKKKPAARKLHVAYIGNFGPPHSTENHLCRALLANGHIVEQVQESDPTGFAKLGDALSSTGSGFDLILWTRTGWPWENPTAVHASQRRMLRLARRAGIPTVGYHLDIWWGLKREMQVWTEPFFEVDLLVTADGGHDEKWEDAGINHMWMPPGVSEAECQLGTPRDEFRSPIAFVGSHDGGYHAEHAHRHELVAWLRTNFRRDCAMWPKAGQPAVRGADLQDLYASVDVVVGDSCFVGTGLANYWSDRIPETIGRGGFLLHPYVTGIEDHFKVESKHNMRYDGEHMWTWEAGDWETLASQIDVALKSPKGIEEIRLAGRAHVLKHHTYEVRVRQLVAALEAKGILK